MATEGKDSQFVQYKLVEVITKLSSLISSKKQIRLWKKGESPFFANLIDIEKDKITFDIKKLPSYLLNLNELILINFCFNDLDFFMKGNVLLLENNELQVIAEDDVFKAERRADERLLTYPHMEVYAYFSVDYRTIKTKNNNESSNVLSFTKTDNLEIDHLKSFFSSRKDDQFPEKWKEDGALDDIELQGFRVMDISTVGFSFCVNLDEDQRLFNTVPNHDFEVYILLDSDSFILSESKLIYSIDFVNPQSSIVPMKKIGMSFGAINDLSHKINSYIDESTLSSELEKDFENLI